jgi:hypothetical protein
VRRVGVDVELVGCDLGVLAKQAELVTDLSVGRLGGWAVGRLGGWAAEGEHVGAWRVRPPPRPRSPLQHRTAPHRTAPFAPAPPFAPRTTVHTPHLHDQHHVGVLLLELHDLRVVGRRGRV